MNSLWVCNANIITSWKMYMYKDEDEKLCSVFDCIIKEKRWIKTLYMSRTRLYYLQKLPLCHTQDAKREKWESEMAADIASDRFAIVFTYFIDGRPTVWIYFVYKYTASLKNCSSKVTQDRFLSINVTVAIGCVSSEFCK